MVPSDARVYRQIVHPLLVFLPTAASVAVIDTAVRSLAGVPVYGFAGVSLGTMVACLSAGLEIIRTLADPPAAASLGTRAREPLALAVGAYLLASLPAGGEPASLFAPQAGNLLAAATAVLSWTVAYTAHGHLRRHEDFLALAAHHGGEDLYLVLRSHPYAGLSFQRGMAGFRRLTLLMATLAAVVHLSARAFASLEGLEATRIPGNGALVALVLVVYAATSASRQLAEKGASAARGIRVPQRLEMKRLLLSLGLISTLALVAFILVPRRAPLSSGLIEDLLQRLALLFVSPQARDPAPVEMTFGDFERLRGYLNELAATRGTVEPAEWLVALASVLRVIVIVLLAGGVLAYLLFPLFVLGPPRRRRGAPKRRLLRLWYAFLRTLRRVYLWLFLVRRKVGRLARSALSDAGPGTGHRGSSVAAPRRRRLQSRRLDREFRDLVAAAGRVGVVYRSCDTFRDFFAGLAAVRPAVEPENLAELFRRGRYSREGLSSPELKELITRSRRVRRVLVN